MQFWSEIILVISNRTRAARSFDFEITRMISDQIALHSVQLPLFINMPKEIYQLSIDVKVLMISFPRFFCPVLSWGRVTLQEKNYITKWPPYFGLLCKWRRSNSGDTRLHDFKHEGLAKITNSWIVQQFLLAQSVSYALATNQIAHYIFGPI